MTKPVVVAEKGRKFTVIAPKDSTCEKIKVDGGLITSDRKKKCDWAIKVSSDGVGHFFFVELKGADLMYAIKQLEATIGQLSDIYKGIEDRQAHAVCSKVTPRFQSGAQVAAVRFKKNHGFLLKWHSQEGRAKCASCG